jgi:hypothetical protein
MSIKKKKIFNNAECKNYSLKGSHIAGEYYIIIGKEKS